MILEGFDDSDYGGIGIIPGEEGESGEKRGSGGKY